MRVTKAHIKKALQSEIDIKHKERKDWIESMSPAAGNPQIAKMIEKNRGYILALEDITEMLYSRKIF